MSGSRWPRRLRFGPFRNKIFIGVQFNSGGGQWEVQPETSNIEHRTSNIEHRTSNIERPTSNKRTWVHCPNACLLGSPPTAESPNPNNVNAVHAEAGMNKPNSPNSWINQPRRPRKMANLAGSRDFQALLAITASATAIQTLYNIPPGMPESENCSR